MLTAIIVAFNILITPAPERWNCSPSGAGQLTTCTSTLTGQQVTAGQ